MQKRILSLLLAVLLISLLPAGAFAESPGETITESAAEQAAVPEAPAADDLPSSGAPELEYFSAVEVNPAYVGHVREEDLLAAAPDPEQELAEAQSDFAILEGETLLASGRGEALLASVHEDFDSAAREVREGMKNHEETIRVILYSEEPWTDEEFRSYYKEIFRMALQHTGKPREGDTLYYGYAGYVISGTRNYAIDGVESYHRYTFKLTYYATLEQEDELDAEVQSLIAGLGLLEMDDFAKTRAIYDYICTNVSYDYAHKSDDSYGLKYTPYAALINKTAVCQGYATAFYRLCLEAGVDARVIKCSEMNHAWNIVQLESFYYELDTTLDAERSRYLYFLCGSESWLSRHRISGVSSLGDQYDDPDFAAAYPLPQADHEHAPILPVPTGFTVSFTPLGKPLASWQASEGAQSYELYFSETESGPFRLLRVTEACSFAMEEAAPGDNCFFRVRAVGEGFAPSRYTRIRGVTAVEEPRFAYSMELKDSIAIRYSVLNLPEGLRPEDYVLEYTYKGETGQAACTAWERNDFVIADCAAKEMTEPVEVRLRYRDTLLREKSYSVRGYAEALLALEPDEKTTALLQSCLDYGSYAQRYFGYRTDDPANRGVDYTDVAAIEIPESTNGKEGQATGILAPSYSLMLESRTTLRVSFLHADDAKAEDYRFAVNGETVTPADSGKSFVMDLKGIAAKNLGDPLVVTVAHRDGTTFTFTTAPVNYMYAARNTAVGDAMKTLYAYNIAAENYFE